MIHPPAELDIISYCWQAWLGSLCGYCAVLHTLSTGMHLLHLIQ
jgi:hypothetical protein